MDPDVLRQAFDKLGWGVATANLLVQLEVRLVGDIAARHPGAFAHLLQALDFHFASVKEVALVGAADSPRESVEPLERVVRSRFRPHLVLAGGEPDGVPLLAERGPVEGRAAAYVCENFACQRPVTTAEELRELLGG